MKRDQRAGRDARISGESRKISLSEPDDGDNLSEDDHYSSSVEQRSKYSINLYSTRIEYPILEKCIGPHA